MGEGLVNEWKSRTVFGDLIKKLHVRQSLHLQPDVSAPAPIVKKVFYC